MLYEPEILQILTEAGQQGLKTSKIARHVYNACNSLFEEVSYQEVYDSVRQYLFRNSKNPQSFIEKGETRGFYRLNIKEVNSQQLKLRFSDYTKENTECDTANEKDTSLSLW